MQDHFQQDFENPAIDRILYRSQICYIIMKNIQALALCLLFFSCSPDSESPPVDSPDDNESNSSLSYEPKGVLLYQT